MKGKTEGAEIIVVGAGPNGLAAGVALAREGHRVVVHEAASQIGGGTRSEELTLPGFVHDVCSAVHPMGIGSPFFRTLPLEQHGLKWIHPPLMMAHPFDDGTAAVLDRSTVATGESLGESDGRAYQRLMDPFVRDWEGVLEDALAPPFHIPRHPFIMARLGWYGMRPAMSLVRHLFDGPRARAMFIGIAAHALLPMEKTPSAAFGIMLALAGHGAGWPIPRGGSQSIANALASLLREHGGRIETDSQVGSLDDFEEARAVVLDVTPLQLLSIAGERLPPRYTAQLRRWRYAPGVFKIDWALSEPIPWTAPECRRAGTLHLGGSAEEIARSAAEAWKGEDDRRPFVLLAQPSLFDPTRAPAGKHTAWAYCHVPHGSTKEMSELIERQVERFAPGFRDTILARHTFNTLELEEHDANLIGGDINGGVQDVRQFLFRPAVKIDPYSTPDPKIFLCSASTPPGGAVHGMCGYYAAQSVLKRLGRR
ncbi:MAG: NAD(P)/FAD-dependent oxidoreductase [Thermoanaerobaculia bacterium]